MKFILITTMLMSIVSCGLVPVEREPDSAIRVLEYEGHVQSGLLAAPYGNFRGEITGGCSVYEWGNPRSNFLYNGKRCIVNHDSNMENKRND